MTFLLLLLLVCVPLQAMAATYYLKPDTGNDSNSGAINSPWQTIYKVKTTVSAGDTINILGGYYYQYQIAGDGGGNPNWYEYHSLGTHGNPIILQANPGDTVTIDGQWAQYFQYFTASATYNGHYIVVRNLNFLNYTGIVIGVATGGVSPHPYTIPAHHVALVNNTFRNIENAQGAAMTPGPSHHVIFKGNYIYNSGSATGGDGFYSSQHSIYCGDQTQYMVIEDNYAELTTGYNIQAWNWHGEINTSRNVIIRRNTLLNARGSNIIMSGLSSTIMNFYVYNNTFYTDALVPYPPLAASTTDSAISFHNNAVYSNINIKNNIGYGPYGYGAIWQPYDATDNGLSALTMDFNHWTSTGGPYTGNTYTVRWEGSEYDLAGFRAATGKDTNSLTGNPSFVDASGRDFTLQSGSDAKDQGTPALTTATSSGSSSTSLTVADAGYFSDGFGLITGDTIRIGNTSPVVVTTVNYATNTLTLASARTWSNGAAVGLDYAGAAPDMGAHESDAVATGPFVYYLNPATGNDNNLGTSQGAPWKTLAKIQINAGPGDVIYVQAGTYTPSQYKGSGGDLWTEGEAAGTAGSPITIQGAPGETVIFDGAATDDHWIGFRPVAGYSPVTSRHVVIKNLEFRNYVSTAIYLQAANHVAVLDSYFHDFFDQAAGMLSTEAASYAIFKGNRLFNQGDPVNGWNGTGDHGIYVGDDSHYIVAANNTIEKIAGFGIHLWNSHGTPNTTSQVIARHNTIVNAASSGLIAAGLTYQNLYFYNNTFYSDPVPYLAIFNGPAEDALTFHNGGTYSNVRVRNNLSYGTYSRAAFSQDDSTDFTNLLLSNNWWSTLTGASNAVKWNNTAYTLAAYQTASGQDANAKTGDPLYANVGARNFTLQQGSQAIDGGIAALTTATSTQSNSTNLAVADAGYFHDGYGLIPGDTIRIANTTPVLVTAVNYATNTITLAQARSWSSGAAVGMDYLGSAPDMGAHESTPPPPPASTYYVAKNGNNTNTCDQAKTAGSTAKLTITAGAGCLSSGDTLLVGDGTYVEALNNVIPSGTASTPTVVRSQNPLGAIIRPASGNFTSIVLLSGKSHITFDGFVVDSTNSTEVGIHTPDSNNIILQNNEVRNMIQVDASAGSAAGIKTSETGTFITIRNNTIHGIGRLGSPVTIPSGHAISCAGSSLLIENNTLFNNLEHGIFCYNPSGTTTTSNNVIRGNRIYSNDSRGMLVGYYGNNNQVYNNLVYGTWRGIQMGNGTGNVVYNNTLYGNNIGPGGGECLILEGTGTARNNICYQNLTDTIAGAGWTLSNNLTGTNPLFMGASSGNFALQSGSNARNAGFTVATVVTDFAGIGRPQESAYDIGAYEFVVGGGPQQGTYYVATSGSDLNTCEQAKTIGTPKRTIASALPCMAGGSTLSLGSGTYVEQIPQNVPSGTSWSAPTTITARPGEMVVLAPGVSGTGRVVELPPGSAYIIFQDLVVDGGGTAANGYLLDTTNHVRIQGGEVKNTVGALILMRGGTANEVIGTQVHTNTNEHCISLNNGNSQALIQGTIVSDCVGAGIYAVADDYPANSNTDAVIRANIVRQAKVGATQAGIVVGHGSFPLVVNNIVHNNPLGIRVDDSTTSAKIINNTITSNTGNGLQIDSGATGTEVTNNILYQNGLDTVVNNGTGTVQTTNLTTDPSFENAGIGDFRLTAGSAARNAGTNSSSAPQDFAGITRPKESTTDIGAYEYDAPFVAGAQMHLPAKPTTGFFAR